MSERGDDPTRGPAAASASAGQPAAAAELDRAGAACPAWAAYALAVVLTAATLGVRLLLAQWLGGRPLLIAFLVPIILSAYVGGLGPGLLATALAAIGTKYTLFPALHSLAFTQSADLAVWLIFIVVGALVSVLNEALHRARGGEIGAPGPTPSLSIERKVQIGFAAGLLLLIVTGAVSYLGVSQLTGHADAARRSAALIDALHLVLLTVSEAESAQRGYAITGDESYAERYRGLLGSAAVQLDVLRAASRRDAAQQPRVAALAALVEERLAHADDVVEARRIGGVAAASALVASGRGRDAQDRARAIAVDIERDEAARYSEREERARRGAGIATIVIATGSALAVLLVTVGLFLLGQDFAGARRAEAAVHAARAELETRVRERTAELARTNESLRDSESRFRQLAESLPQLVWTCGADGACDYMSPGWVRFTGRPEATQLGLGWLEQLHPDDRERTMAAWREACAAGAVFQVEYRIRRHDGVYRWFDTRAVPWRDAAGRVVKWFGSNTDIEEGRALRESLRESEQFGRQIVGSLQEGLFVLDRDLRYRVWNRAAEEISALPAERALGRHPDELFPALREEGVFALLERALAGETFVADDAFVRGDRMARGRWLSQRLGPLRDAHGEINGVIASVTDITERKQAEETLSVQNAVSRVLADAQSLGDAAPKILRALAERGGWDAAVFWEVDPKASVLRCAHSWYRPDQPLEALMASMRELTVARGVGIPGEAWAVAEARSGGHQPPADDDRRAALAAAELRDAVAFPVLYGGTVMGVVELLGRDAREPAGGLLEAFGAIGRQMGQFVQRRRAEDDVRQLNAELEARVSERTAALEAAQEELVRAERLALLGQVAGAISHELRNPLAVINNAVYYLNMVLPRDERTRKHLGIIEREVLTATKIISGLLDFARVRPANLVRAELGSLLQDHFEREPLPERVTLAWTPRRDLPAVLADPDQVRLVLGNLVSNAVQAMPDGGVLAIDTTVVDGGVALTVADTGCGIAAEHLAKIFEPLFSTKAKGFGLGLALVRRLVEQNGGSIRVESAPGQGSRFTVVLPAGPNGSAPAG